MSSRTSNEHRFSPAPVPPPPGSANGSPPGPFVASQRANVATANRGARPHATRWRWLRALTLAGVIAVPVTVGVLWWAVHRFVWAGPLVANTLRSIIGVDNVARLEDFAYGVQDRYQRFSRRNEAPKTYWEVPSAASAAPVPPRKSVDPETSLSPFRPADVGPVHQKWSAPGDGVWVPIQDPRRPQEQPYLYKTLLHPDPYRSWADVFVVAVDLRRTQLHVVAGYQEPKSLTKEGQEKYPERTPSRKAVIPPEHHEELLAAFNGGFMAEHGFYGMYVEGVTLVAPREAACCIAGYPDGRVAIRSWKEIEPTREQAVWWRQTPWCMYESGKMHLDLASSSARRWGATLDGETVIRRSAIGISENGEILYVSITNNTNARVIAQGMHHAGAYHVAQLDVNWSYPKFLLYEPREPGGPRKAVPLAAGFEFDEDIYIRKADMRDFFYLRRKSLDEVRAFARHKQAPNASLSAAVASAASAVPSAPTPSGSALELQAASRR